MTKTILLVFLRHSVIYLHSIGLQYNTIQYNICDIKLNRTKRHECVNVCP